MNNTKKTTKTSFSIIEKKLIDEIIELAPDIQKTLYKLIKAGNSELYASEFPKLNPVLFLLSEFIRRTKIVAKIPDKQEGGFVPITK